ncbi:MAG: penicillin acylase family protein [Sphingobacteriales bacterium]|nr:penicillin acylase family protein [Sphingobacteriales bacterium]
MKYAKAFFSLLLAAIVVISFNTKLSAIPPLGKFLDPFHGFWNNAENKHPKTSNNLKIDGLKGSVEIKFDEHMIPHVFAESNDDLYFAQGYITAKDRLWQMDFQTRFAAGRLSEVVGSKAIELDKYQRRMGMVFGAENMVKAMKNDPVSQKSIEAYAAGVNAYIKSLSPGEYPIEFKILNYEPEKWTPLNTALLLKLMSATLAGGSNEFYMSNILNKYGADVVNNLFPDYPFHEDPIIPAGTKWNFKPLPIPTAPSLSDPGKTSQHKTKELEEGIGSNNWAVSGAKSASGYPLLANDPHLELSLPAIWYQIQLVSNDVNVYGVSIPAAPGVIIGFNKNVAWGVTNVGADVLDWYSVKFKDQSKKEYWYNNKWNPVKVKIETIKVSSGETVLDTVYYTHQGPVVYIDNEKPASFSKAGNIPEGHALRWVAHDASNDTRTFYMLNRAKNYTDYRKALTYYSAPAQNFVFASVENDIAITPNGYFPLKWKDQGKFLLSGADPANDWHGRIPADQNPTVKNPPRNFVSSANQFSTDKTYPYYLNWEFAGYERGHRINSRLAAMTNVTIDSLRNLQNDNYSILAENILPTLIKNINTENLNATEQEGFEIVSKWGKFFNTKEIGASIFEIWRKDLSVKIWGDEFGDPKVPMRFPSTDRTVEMLINEPNAVWFDNIKTTYKETRNDQIQASFKFAIDSLQRKFGALGDKWQWGNVKHSYVPHLAKIPGFSSKFLNNGGSKTSVNALSETNGPSWRMVIALGKNVKGYGLFPGGESGNPGSFYYDDMIENWSNGKLNELLYLQSKNEKSTHIISSLILNKTK